MTDDLGNFKNDWGMSECFDGIKARNDKHFIVHSRIEIAVYNTNNAGNRQVVINLTNEK